MPNLSPPRRQASDTSLTTSPVPLRHGLFFTHCSVYLLGQRQKPSWCLQVRIRSLHPRGFAGGDPLVGVERRGIEQLGSSLPSPHSRSVKVLMPKWVNSGELNLLPGDLLRSGRDVGRLAQDLCRNFPGRRNGKAETDQNVCDAGGTLRHGDASRRAIGGWVGFGRNNRYNTSIRVEFQPPRACCGAGVPPAPQLFWQALMDAEPVTKDRAAARRLPRNVKVLGWASLLNDVAGEMVYPLLPKFLFTVLGGGMTWLGTIDGTAESLSSLVKLWSGNRIDRGGRHKWFVVFGYGLAALTRPLAGVVQLPWQLFGVRVAERLGKGVHAAPRDAMIADAAAPEIRGRAFGFRQSMDHVGAAVGTLAAAGFLWLWPGALRTLFLLTLLPGVAVVALLWLGLRSPSAEKRGTGSVCAKHPPGRSGKRCLSPFFPFDRKFRFYLLALVVFTLGNSSDLFLLRGRANWAWPTGCCPFSGAPSA